MYIRNNLQTLDAIKMMNEKIKKEKDVNSSLHCTEY